MDIQHPKDLTSLTSGFHGEAANDAHPRPDTIPGEMPHEILQTMMDAEMSDFIGNFHASVTDILQTMNMTAQMDKQENRTDTVRESIHLEIAMGANFPLQLWQIAVSSYHDHTRQNDLRKFKDILSRFSAEDIAMAVEKGRYDDADKEHEAVVAFSRAYIQELRVFTALRDLFSQNIKGVHIALDMHQIEEGFIAPIMVIEPQDGQSALRVLIKHYIDSTKGHAYRGLTPV